MKNSRYIIFNQNETKGQIEAAQSDMTQVEHTIANYFLNNEELTDFSFCPADRPMVERLSRPI